MALPSLILITLVVATGAILLAAAAEPPQLCDAAGQPDDLVKKLCQLRTAANQLSNDITAVLIETGELPYVQCVHTVTAGSVGTNQPTVSGAHRLL